MKFPSPWLGRVVLLGLLCLTDAPQSATAAPLPGESVYNLHLPLLDQRGEPIDFASLRGRPRLITMFYTSCPYMCPLIIDTARMSERALDEDERTRLSVLMVSFDAVRDNPAALKMLVDKRRIDTSRWTLARTDAAQVRKLAAILGIQYRPLEDGEFSHTSVLILVDADGRIVARSEVMGRIDPDFIAAIKRVLGAG